MMTFRSDLERDWSATLDALGITWQYEPKRLTLSDGTRYVPDFWLPELRTWFEVKGPHRQRVSKTMQLSRDVRPSGVLVVIGWAPEFGQHRRVLRGRYDGARFGMCAQCSRRQWLLTLNCRSCSADVPAHNLYPHGDMPFTTDDGRFGGVL